jgi:DNA-binding NtrC family response regulator
MSDEGKRRAESTLSSDTAAELRIPTEEQPFLFVMLQADQPLAPCSRHALGHIDEVHMRRGTARAHVRVVDKGVRQLVLMLPDPRMSSEHARVVRTSRGWRLEDVGSKNGTMLRGERVTEATVHNGDVIEVGRTFLYFRAGLPFRPGLAADATTAELDPPTASLTTLSPELGRTFEVLNDVARSSIPIHISGETGTGKEVLARSIHIMSGRRGPFVAVNCGGLPPTLVEAELFGYRKGAFSGALDERVGLVRTADEGTLFLDEIGDLPHAAQAAILRVLQEREVLPIGSDKPVPVNLRLVSATHRDLEAAARAGHFRADLLARLAGYRVKLPALRERREDLGSLLARLLERIEDVPTTGVRLSPAAARALVSHAWPRNIRELEHRIRLGVVLAKEGLVDVDHVFGPDAEPLIVTESEERRTIPPSQWTGIHHEPALGPQDVATREAVEVLLRAHQGNISAVARSMGKARVQIQRWIKRYGLDPRQYRA